MLTGQFDLLMNHILCVSEGERAEDISKPGLLEAQLLPNGFGAAPRMLSKEDKETKQVVCGFLDWSTCDGPGVHSRNQTGDLSCVADAAFDHLCFVEASMGRVLISYRVAQGALVGHGINLHSPPTNLHQGTRPSLIFLLISHLPIWRPFGIWKLLGKNIITREDDIILE